MGECTTTTVGVSHDAVRIKVAVEFVFANSFSDTEEQEDYDGNACDTTDGSTNDDTRVAARVAAT